MYYVYLDKTLIHDLNSEDNILVNPTVSLELNKAGTFEFSMEPTHPYYNKLERFKSIVQVLQDGDEIFKGRIVEVTDDMNKERSVYCESELAYLNDTIQRPYEYQLATDPVRRYLEDVIAEHNEQVDSNLQFTVGIVDISDPNNYLYCYTNYDTTMESIKEDLVDDYGGYIKVRNVYSSNNPLGTLSGRYLDYVPLDEYGSRSTQYIEFGENLLDFTSDIDQTDICTGIIPLGATLEESSFDAIDERLTIKDVNGGIDYLYIPEAVEKYGLILKTVTWDDITVASNLLTAAQQYLKNMAYDDMVIEAKAVDLHLTDEQVAALRLGDMVRVISKPHDLDEWFPLAQMTIPLDQPENTQVTLGTFEDTSLTARTNEVRSGLRDFEDFTVGNVIASAVAQANALIKGATHGYVTLSLDDDGHPYEILIMDAPEVSDAKKIWRWNSGGLGYTSGGYDDGDYALAMTIDGHILGTLLIANGAILADDRDVEFAKFDDTGMKIYAQSGRSDLLLMSIGREGLTLYDDSGKNVLATFYSDGVKIYSTSGAVLLDLYSNGLTVNNNSETTLMTLNQYGLRLYDSGGALRSSIDSDSFDVYDSSENPLMRMNTSGAQYYYSNNLVGTIGTSYWTGYPNNRGLTFNLEYGSAYMAFGWKKSSNASTYTAMIAFHTNSSSETQGVHFGDNLLLNNYQLYLGASTSGAYLQGSSDNGLIINGGPLYIQQTGYYNGYEIADQQWVLDQIQGGGSSGVQYGDALSVTFQGDAGQVQLNTSYSQSMTFDLRGIFDASVSGDIVCDNVYACENMETRDTVMGYYVGSVSYMSMGFLWCNDVLNRTYGGIGFFYPDLAGGDGNPGGNNLFCYVDVTYTQDCYFGYNPDGGWYSSRTTHIQGRSIKIGESTTAQINIGGSSSDTDIRFTGYRIVFNSSVIHSSDKRLKTSIQPLEETKLDNLKPVTFKWKDRDDRAHYGYIAQQVQEHIPELVHEGTDGMLGITYNEIIPLLHAKINEQQAQIESLEDRIKKLEELVNG